MAQQTDYDIIIVGTGIAGQCAALEGLMAGARVLMVDSEEKTGGSSRLSTGILMGANTRYQRSKGVTDDTPDRLYRLYMSANQWLLQPSVAKRLCWERARPWIGWRKRVSNTWTSACPAKRTAPAVTSPAAAI